MGNNYQSDPGGDSKRAWDEYNKNQNAAKAQADADAKRNREQGVFAYGGQVGRADQQKGFYDARATGIENRDPTANYRDAQASRQYQQAAYNAYAQAASGQGPSAAQMAGDLASDRAAAQQASIAGSARGPAALALAGQQAAQQTAVAQQGIAGQTMVGRQQEMDAARAGMAQAASSLRGADIGYGSAVTGAQNANDQLGMGYRQMGEGVLARDDAGRAAGAGFYEDKRRYDNAQDRQDYLDQQNEKNNNWKTAGAAMNAVGSFLGAGAMLSDVSTKTKMSPLGALAGLAGLGGGSGSPGGAPAIPGGEGTAALPGLGALGTITGGFGNMVGLMSDVRSKTKMSPVTDAEVASVERQVPNILGAIQGIGSEPTTGGVRMAPTAAESKQVDGSVKRTLASLQQPATVQVQQSASAMEPYLASLRGALYDYKPESGGPPGTQVGPASAQAIASTPIGSTVVGQGPTGKLAIEPTKALKTGMAADAYLNDKTNAIGSELASLKMLLGSLAAPAQLQQILAQRKGGG